MTKKKAESSNLAVLEFPPVDIVHSKGEAGPKTTQELHLIQIDDGYKPKSIFVNRSWNKEIKDRK